MKNKKITKENDFSWLLSIRNEEGVWDCETKSKLEKKKLKFIH